MSALDLSGLPAAAQVAIVALVESLRREQPASPAPVPAATEPRYLGVTAYARRAGVSLTTVRGWIRDGLPCTNATGRQRVIVADADRWIEQGPGARPLRVVDGGRK